jgi:uncharacterized pyridoxamine 5'-phosphate oxidase family protein
MTSPTAIRDSILTLLTTTGFAVLATENAGQPHTSLIAITPFNEGQRLVFATYRNTQKFTNLMQNKRVSVLIDGRHQEGVNGALASFILSVVGRVQEIPAVTHPQLLSAHLQKHPDLAAFTHAPDCVLLEVVVEAYQVVRGIDDVTWWCADDLRNLPSSGATERVDAEPSAST